MARKPVAIKVRIPAAMGTEGISSDSGLNSANPRQVKKNVTAPNTGEIIRRVIQPITLRMRPD